MAAQVVYRTEFFREQALYVGLAPELNVSSFGETLEEAKHSLEEAVEAFLEECRLLGTLDEVLEESGFLKRGNHWLSRQPVVVELMTSRGLSEFMVLDAVIRASEARTGIQFNATGFPFPREYGRRMTSGGPPEQAYPFSN